MDIAGQVVCLQQACTIDALPGVGGEDLPAGRQAPPTADHRLVSPPAGGNLNFSHRR